MLVKSAWRTELSAVSQTLQIQDFHKITHKYKFFPWAFDDVSLGFTCQHEQVCVHRFSRVLGGGCESLVITTGSSQDTLMTSPVRPSYAGPVILQLIPNSLKSYIPTPACLLGLLLWYIKVRDWPLWIAGPLPHSTPLCGWIFSLFWVAMIKCN